MVVHFVFMMVLTVAVGVLGNFVFVTFRITAMGGMGVALLMFAVFTVVFVVFMFNVVIVTSCHFFLRRLRCFLFLIRHRCIPLQSIDCFRLLHPRWQANRSMRF